MAWEREKGYGPEDIATGKYFESIEDAYDHAYSLLERFSDPLPRLPISTLEMDATYNFKTHRWGLRDFHGGRILIMTKRTSDGKKWAEIGTGGLETWSGFVSEAYHSKLMWPSCFPLFNRIRRSDPEISIVRQLFSALARRVSLKYEAGVDEPQEVDEKAVAFGNEVLADLEGGVSQLVDTIVSYVPFLGWGWWEVVPALRREGWKPPDDDPWRSRFDDGLLGIRKLAFRDHSSFKQWDMDDDTGRLYGFVQHDSPNPEVTIPLEQSLHLKFGDNVNPEGLSPLEAIWRLERIKYGLEIVQGIGFEHAAGYLDVKSEADKLTSNDIEHIKRQARAILTAQEGNFASWPKGYSGEIKDIPFSAAPAILDAIKYYGILKLQIFSMQWIALSSTTGTGSFAAKKEDTTMFVLYFNAMMEGFAEQIGTQLEPWIFGRNAEAFPGLEQKPKLVATKLDKTVDLAELTTWVDMLLERGFSLDDDDAIWIRQRAGMRESLPVDDSETIDEVPDSKESEDSDESKGEDSIDEEDVRGALSAFSQWATKRAPWVNRIMGAKVKGTDDDE
jgi:hypothetical protein